jgi:hypothetical protein
MPELGLSMMLVETRLRRREYNGRGNLDTETGKNKLGAAKLLSLHNSASFEVRRGPNVER